MNNPLEILKTLDGHLTKPAEITIFGRSALALGFEGAPAVFATTHDVALNDIQFLLSQEPFTADELRAVFTRARVPDVPEIHELFQKAQIRVLAMVERATV